jgi:hypothetical protein
LPFGRPVKTCSTINEKVSPAKVDPSTYGVNSLKETPRSRQNIALRTSPSNPLHLFNGNRNASTADSKQAVANAEINKVPI